MARPRSQSADEVANQRVTSSLQPLLDAIAADRAAAQARAEQARAAEAARIQGFSLAAAEAMRGVGGQINQIYGDAASRQATFGKGVADGFRMAMQGNEAQANALLAQHGGAPLDSVAQQGGNAIHGLGGYLPATELNTQGAAFGAAAAMLPQTALGRGEQDLRDARFRWSQQDQEISDSYDSERRRLLAEVPGLVERERAAIFERNRVKRDEAFRERQFAEEQKQAKINAQIQWQSVKGTLAAYGLDEKRLLQAEAEFMTQQTGVIYRVKNGRVVATGQPAPGSAAAQNQASANSAAADTAADRKKARDQARANKADALTTASGAVRDASRDWASKPIENPKFGNDKFGLGPKNIDGGKETGKYLTQNGLSTNDPAKAAREGGLTWGQMVNQAMQMEEVQQLVTRYGMSRAKARAKVVAWLRSLGYKPPTSPRTRTPRRVSSPDTNKTDRG